MWRAQPFAFAGTVILSLAGIGLFILIPWWLIYRNQQLTITDDTVRYEEGVFSKKSSEMRLRDVRNVQVEQSFLHRLTNAGEMRIASAGKGQAEIVVTGVPNPSGIRKQIEFRQTRQSAQE